MTRNQGIDHKRSQQQSAFQAIDPPGSAKAVAENQQCYRQPQHDRKITADQIASDRQRADQPCQTDHDQRIEKVRADDIADCQIVLTTTRGNQA